MSTKIGKAKYGSNYVAKKYAKLKDGESVFRILPPLGDLADKGIWSVFYNIHYGYKNSEGKLRTFQSPLVKNRKTKMIEATDAAYDRITALKAKLAEAKESGNKELTERLLKYVGPKGMYNLDSNHYMNAVDTQGNIVVLKIRHRAKVALDATIKALREGGTDPLSAEDGRFFVFRRTGNGLDTSFQVTVYTEKLNVPGVGLVSKEVVHSLNDELIGRLGSEAAELDKLFKKLSSEDVSRIVSTVDIETGKSSVIDELFSSPSSSSSEEEPEDLSTGDDYSAPEPTAPAPVAAAPVAATVTAPAPTPKAEPAPVAPKAETLAAHTPTASASKTTAQAVSEMSNEDFLKSLGL